MPGLEMRRVGMERMGMLDRMRMHVGNFAGGVALGLKLMAPAATIGAAAIFAQGCDTAKVECESQPVTQVNDGIFRQIVERMSQGVTAIKAVIPVKFTGIEMDRSPSITVTIGTANDRVGANGAKELEFRGEEEQGFDPCPEAGPIMNCSPFAGEAYDGAIYPVGIQKTFEGSRLYENIKEGSANPGMWAGIGPVVDRIWGHKVFMASDLFTVYQTKIDMSSGEPVEKPLYLETDREGYVLDADGHRQTTEEDALANGRDISELVDPSIQAGQPNAGMDPQTPDALGLEQEDGIFPYDRATDAWSNLDANNNPAPDFSLNGSDYDWTPVIDSSKTLGEIYENMIANNVDPTVYAIPLKVKASIRDLRNGSELGEVDLGEITLGDFLRGPISFVLPQEYMAEAVNAEVTIVAQAIDLPLPPETALVFDANLQASVKLEMASGCEAPADGGSE